MIIVVAGDVEGREDEDGHASADSAQSEGFRILWRLHDVENGLSASVGPFLLQEKGNGIQGEQDEALPFRESRRESKHVADLELLALVAFFRAELRLRDEGSEIDENHVVLEGEAIVVVGEPERRCCFVMLGFKMHSFPSQRHFCDSRVRVRRSCWKTGKPSVEIFPRSCDDDETVQLCDWRVSGVECDFRISHEADRQRSGSKLHDETRNDESSSDQNFWDSDRVNVLSSAVQIHVVPRLIVDVRRSFAFFLLFGFFSRLVR